MGLFFSDTSPSSLPWQGESGNQQKSSSKAGLQYQPCMSTTVIQMSRMMLIIIIIK